MCLSPPGISYGRLRGRGYGDVGRLKIVVAIVVTAMWAAVYGSWLLSGMPDPQPPAELSGIMLAVVTALFGSDLRDRARKALGEGDGGRSDGERAQ